jgi:hypothetical protein
MQIKNIKKFKHFLVEAKKNTYASDKRGVEKILLTDGCKELIFSQKPWIYRDRYFGAPCFIGEEIVFENKKAIWGMNYRGEILGKKIKDEDIVPFLKKALSRVEQKIPFRGPKIIKEKNKTYKNSASGDIDNFQGKEVIYFEQKKIYELYYHGGFIKK